MTQNEDAEYVPKKFEFATAFSTSVYDTFIDIRIKNESK